MTVNELFVKDGKVICTDGRLVTPRDRCRFCIHSRYFVINGIQERSPALAFCMRERVTKEPDIAKATAVGCADERHEGYTSIGNIIS